MERYQDRNVLSKLLHESIVQLCKVSVGIHSNISIDGIICIATQQDDREIVVKIHEQVSRSPEATKNIVPTPKVATPNFRNNDDSIFGKFPESGKTPVHIQNSRDFVFCSDEHDLFGDLADIKAIMPLNRSQPIEAQMNHTATAPMETVVNLIDEDTEGYSNDKHVNTSETMVMVKPDPGTVSSSCTVANITPTSNCSVTSVIQTQYASPQTSSPHSGPISNLKTLFDESSDDDLKIEKLKAGRTRKNKRQLSESSNRMSPCRMSPSELVAMEMPSQPPTGEATQAEIQLTEIICEVDEPEITAVNPSTTNREDIKPILARKQMSIPTPTSTHATTQVITQTPPAATAYTNITPATVESSDTLYTNIAPKQVMVEDTPVAPNPTPSETNTPVQSPKTAIRRTGVTVAQQLQQLRKQTFNLIPMQPMQAPKATTPGIHPQPPTVNMKFEGSEAAFPIPENSFKLLTYTCPKCGVMFTLFKKFHLHMFQSHNMFPCPCCEKMFTHRYTRNRHIVTHHAGEKTFTCPVCGKKYVRADTLKLHVQRQHPQNAGNLRIHYSYAHGKQLYDSNHALAGSILDDNINLMQPSTSSEKSEHHPDAFGKPESEVVYNRNLPSKFESVDSDSSNLPDIDHNEDAVSEAQVVSQDTAVINTNAQIQYLKMESMQGEEVAMSQGEEGTMSQAEEGTMEGTMSQEDTMLDHDDIMDMIEISDDESMQDTRS